LTVKIIYFFKYIRDIKKREMEDISSKFLIGFNPMVSGIVSSLGDTDIPFSNKLCIGFKLKQKMGNYSFIVMRIIGGSPYITLGNMNVGLDTILFYNFHPDKLSCDDPKLTKDFFLEKMANPSMVCAWEYRKFFLYSAEKQQSPMPDCKEMTGSDLPSMDGGR
jgi:hypothetical protein